MVKSLLNKVIKGVRNTVLLAGAVYSLSGCPTPITQNYSPKTTLTANPDSIQVGESVQLRADGTDQNGKDDIVEYRLEIDENGDGLADETITQSTPIQYDRTFNNSGSARVYGVCTDAEGLSDRTEKTITINDIDYLDINGYLQDNETDSAQRGRIKVYDARDTSFSNPLAEVYTDENGHFGLNSDNIKVSDLPSGIAIRAVGVNQDGTPNSYVRTKTFPAGDVILSDSEPIRVVPYPTFGCSNEDFREFMRRTNISQALTYDLEGRVNEIGLSKWDLSQFQGIEILMENPLDSTNSFTEEQQMIIAEKIRNSLDIERFVGGKELDDYIQIDSLGNIPPEGRENHYTANNTGWILIIPDKNCLYAGITSPNCTAEGIINSAIVKLRPGYVLDGNPVVSHELGHAFIAPNGEAINLHPNTVMVQTGGTLLEAGLADKKAGELIYEDTYSPKEKLDDILEMNF